LWHGNSWKYILGVGLWFWLTIVLGQIANPVFVKLIKVLHIKVDSYIWNAFQILRTFILFSVGNIFFRAATYSDALKRLFNGFHIKMNFQFLYDIKSVVDFSDMGGKFGIICMIISMIAVMIVDYMVYKNIDVREKLAGRKWFVRWILYYALVILIILSWDISNQESLYAQF
jgi:hypothetical protein